MLALMVALLSIAVVGAGVTLQMVAAVPELNAIEEHVAANFLRYSQSVRCYARANPGFTGAAPDITTLKAATYMGAPCLHPAVNFIQPYYGVVTATQVMVYMPSNKTIRQHAWPAQTVAKYTDRLELTGIVGSDGMAINSPSGGYVGQLPTELQTATPRPTVGSPVRITNRS